MMHTILSPRHRRARPTRRTGFTLTEVLAILAILALLAGLRLPAMAKATGLTKRALCANNLRQVALALQVYGTEYNDRLPVSSAGSWLWDFPWNSGPLLERYGTGWKLWYCPGTAPRFTDTDNYRLYNYAPGSYRVLGYALTLPGTSSLNPTNANPTLTPQAIQQISLSFPPPQPSQRVLVADANLTPAGQNNPSLKSTYNWTSIKAGYPTAHTSPHLNGFIPAGRNAAMLDGHVDWRRFDSFLPRTTGNVPSFWW